MQGLGFLAVPGPSRRVGPPGARGMSPQDEPRHRSRCCWAQPYLPLSATYPPRAEHVAARDAADFRPLNPISVLLIRLTLPFLSRWWIERLYETLRACKQMTKMNTPISAGVEFSPATPLPNDHVPAMCSVVSLRRCDRA